MKIFLVVSLVRQLFRYWLNRQAMKRWGEDEKYWIKATAVLWLRHIIVTICNISVITPGYYASP